MRHLIDPLDFTLEETTKVLDLADRIAENPEVYSHVANGKKIATLFYEPSTRTRLSFESAMLSLGGKALGFAGLLSTSKAKGLGGKALGFAGLLSTSKAKGLSSKA